MSKKQFCISFSCHTKLSIYPFLLPILFMIIRFFNDKVIELSKPEFKFKILKYNFPYLFYNYLPKILSIILIPIIKYNTSYSSEHNTLSRRYHFIKESENRKKLFLLIFIISLLEVIFETGECLLYYYQRSGGRIKWLIEKKTIYIIFVPIFCYFILNKEIHKHHILALILGFIGACIINTCRFFLGFSEIEEYPFHLLSIFFSCLYSFALVLIKYLMLKFLILSPYIFLFLDGIFCIINSFICILFEYLIVNNLPDDYLEENDKYFSNNFLGIFTLFHEQNWEFFLYFFGFFILSFIYYSLNVLTIYNYSPYLFILLEAFLPIDNDIINLIFSKENNDNFDNIIKRTYIQSIGYLFLFFAALILNEMIILNCFGFNQDTYSRISLRGIIDSNDLMNKYQITQGEGESIYNESISSLGREDTSIY